MTDATQETGNKLALNGSGLPDLNKPSVAIKFADMWANGKLDRLSAEQQGIFLAALGQHMGVRAELGDLMIYQGKPYITISGYRRIAHQTGLLSGIDPRPAGERDRRIYKCEADDHLWTCLVYKKGSARSYLGWGHVAVKTDRNPVSKTHPQQMAKKRAIYDALRLAFPPNELIGPMHTAYSPEAEAEAERRATENAPSVGHDFADDDILDGDLIEATPEAVKPEEPEMTDADIVAQDSAREKELLGKSAA
jgi:hypothetical protein